MVPFRLLLQSTIDWAVKTFQWYEIECAYCHSIACFSSTAVHAPLVLHRLSLYPFAMELMPRRYQASKQIMGVIRKGHPWIHRNALSSAIEALPSPSLLRIVDGDNRFAANAIYEPHSSIALRLLPDDDPFTPECLTALLRALCGEKKKEGQAFRLLNGEGDLFPGLACDLYGDVAVWQPYLEFWMPLLPLFADTVTRELGTASHLLKPPSHRGGHTTLIGGAPVAEPLSFSEGGLTFLSFPFTGQKTGFYLDLKKVRLLLPKLVMGKRVLNLFANNGAFALIARRHGATEMLSVDSDREARAQAEMLFAANGFTLPADEWRCAEVFETLRSLAAEERRFDLVIIDPPNMCTSKKSLIPAYKGWEKLLRQGSELLAEGGLLLAINCSSFMPKKGCEEAVGELTLKTLKSGGLPEDHTARPSFPEGYYLKWWVYSK